MIDAVCQASLIALSVGFMLCVIRAVKGPTIHDAVLAFDGIFLHLLAVLLVLSVAQGTALYLDTLLTLSLLGFLSTVAFAAYLEETLGD